MKITLPEEQAEQIVKALIENGEIILGTKTKSLLTLKGIRYEVEINNVRTQKRSKRTAFKITATKGYLFKNRY